MKDTAVQCTAGGGLNMSHHLRFDCETNSTQTQASQTAQHFTVREGGGRKARLTQELEDHLHSNRNPTPPAPSSFRGVGWEISLHFNIVHSALKGHRAPF